MSGKKKINISCQAFSISIQSEDGRDTLKSMNKYAKDLITEYFENGEQTTETTEEPKKPNTENHKSEYIR